MKHINTSFAEVVESSLHHCIGHSWSWDHTPPFGSLIVVRDGARVIFGIVHHVQTGSADPSRSPFPYKKTHEELQKEQPHIFEFLKTTFTCALVAYRESAHITYAIAPEPPKIHAFIAPASPELAQQFFSSIDYLYVLFGLKSALANFDELLLALVKHGMVTGAMQQQAVRAFMETYKLLASGDYKQTKLFFARVQTMLVQSK